MKQEAENKQTNLNVDEPNHHFQSKFEKNSSHQGEVLHGKPGSQATVRTTYQVRRPQDPSAPVMQEVTEGEEPKGQAEATGRGQGRPRSGDQLTTRRRPVSLLLSLHIPSYYLKGTKMDVLAKSLFSNSTKILTFGRRKG